MSLHLLNSLTRQKDLFKPKGPVISWYVNLCRYCCGPTVYDHSHLGHARTYVSFDIMRRIFTDYFGNDVSLCMNITDIDDKIIVNARREHLHTQFVLKHTTLEKAVPVVRESLGYYIKASFGVEKDAMAAFIADHVPNVDPLLDFKISTVKACEEALRLAESVPPQITHVEFIAATRVVAAAFLDNKLAGTVTDPAVFKEFSTYWEQAFFADMDALNVRRPDILLRVSECVPDIVTYIETIVKNGFAYEVDGSVYFDTVKFDRDPGHTYCKLEPKSAAGVKQASAMQEGSDDVDTADRDAAHALANAQAEGELSQITPLAKRHPADFALWKQSKLGEPRWDSPWGSGRPGWHIECSVMASSVFGSQMDIHSGGIDLAFPHHDNEIAQAESHYNCGKEGWVRHFVHTGHLHIQGLKMSKSLKNFKTIQEALQETSADQLRLLFLSRAWEQTLDYSSGSVQEAKNLETTITNFLDLVKAHQQAAVGKPHAYAQAERDLVTVLDQSKQAVRAALLDSFNTVGVMQEIKKLIVGGNAYLKRQGPVNVDAVGMYAAFISRMLKIFGLVLREGSSESQDQMFPVVKALAEFRDSVRTIAKSTVVKGGGDKEAGKELLELCDRVRDVDLVELGVQLDDQDGPALVKIVGKAQIEQVRAEKLRQEQEKKDRLEARLAAEQKKASELLRLQSIDPVDMFRCGEFGEVGEFKEFDERGIPTVLADGTPVSKSRRKKLEKEWDRQSKLFIKKE